MVRINPSAFGRQHPIGEPRSGWLEDDNPVKSEPYDLARASAACDFCVKNGAHTRPTQASASHRDGDLRLSGPPEARARARLFGGNIIKGIVTIPLIYRRRIRWHSSTTPTRALRTSGSMVSDFEEAQELWTDADLVEIPARTSDEAAMVIDWKDRAEALVCSD